MKKNTLKNAAISLILGPHGSGPARIAHRAKSLYLAAGRRGLPITESRAYELADRQLGREWVKTQEHNKGKRTWHARRHLWASECTRINRERIERFQAVVRLSHLAAV